MPILAREGIYKIAFHLLRSAGAPDGHATTVANHLAEANLAGHDSHGFLRISQYLKEIKDGSLAPDGQPEVVLESAGIAQVNGNGTFGQVVATMATELAIGKARQNGISLVTMRDLGHTGRVGTYPEMAAKEGMAATMCTGFVGAQIGRNVAPFGGTERKLGTNPISMSFPYLPDSPVLLDFATSVAAEGKLRFYRAKGQSLPDAWVLNKDGAPSDDPNDYYDGGSILPLGGLQSGHKGYALSVMVSLFGAIMGGLGGHEQVDGFPRIGSSITVIDVGRMAPAEDLRAQVGEMVRYLKDTPLAEGSKAVLYPGEIEAMTRGERLANGVEVPQATWDEMAELIREHGLGEELLGLGERVKGEVTRHRKP